MTRAWTFYLLLAKNIDSAESLRSAAAAVSSVDAVFVVFLVAHSQQTSFSRGLCKT
jgi:hypothetical protein